MTTVGLNSSRGELLPSPGWKGSNEVNLIVNGWLVSLRDEIISRTQFQSLLLTSWALRKTVVAGSVLVAGAHSVVAINSLISRHGVMFVHGPIVQTVKSLKFKGEHSSYPQDKLTCLIVAFYSENAFWWSLTWDTMICVLYAHSSHKSICNLFIQISLSLVYWSCFIMVTDHIPKPFVTIQ